MWVLTDNLYQSTIVLSRYYCSDCDCSSMVCRRTILVVTPGGDSIYLLIRAKGERVLAIHQFYIHEFVAIARPSVGRKVKLKQGAAYHFWRLVSARTESIFTIGGSNTDRQQTLRTENW